MILQIHGLLNFLGNFETEWWDCGLGYCSNVQTRDAFDRTLLHACARLIAVWNTLDWIPRSGIEQPTAGLIVSMSNSYILSWTYVMRDDFSLILNNFLKAGLELHAIGDSGRTSMLSTIFEIRVMNSPRFGSWGWFNDRVMSILRDWLNILKSGGVDLQKYGETEKSLFDKGEVDQDVLYWPNIFKNPLVLPPPWRLISFAYGPSVDDWCFWGSEVTDEFAGTFWEMVDHPEWNMPGAWIFEY